MSKFIMRPEDELPHKAGPESNFNESVYTNGFDTASPVGGWMRLGNRANEGYAELSVCLYLPDGRIACQFQRPSISGNDRFDAGGLSYSVVEPLKSVKMEYDGDLIIVEDPDALRDPRKLFADGPRLAGRVAWTHEAESPVHGGEPVDDSAETSSCRLRTVLKMSVLWSPSADVAWDSLMTVSRMLAPSPRRLSAVVLMTDPNGLTPPGSVG